MNDILIVPGLNNSEPEHWQSWLEQRTEGAIRVNQADWTVPDLDKWARRVGKQIRRAANPVIIVAHSFGCLAAAKAGLDASECVLGMLLVAPADPENFRCGQALPKVGLPGRSILVGSRNDPWMTFECARAWAGAWGTQFVDAGYVGHINVSSGHGVWPLSLALLDDLQRQRDRQLALRAAN